MNSFLIYGATGYTGGLVVREALRQGLRPILGGRSAAKLQPLASELGLEYRAFDLANPAAIRDGLAGVSLLLNLSGPFKRTAGPLVDACLTTRTHYLDLAGEVPEFEALVARDAAAQAAGVMLLPGVGFGVVPTDCLAAHLKSRLPGATRLTLAFQTVGGVSRGTAETVIEDLPKGGVVRRNGRLEHVPTGWKTLPVDFGSGPVTALYNPWRGDLSTAYHSTGIPNIETYAVIPPPMNMLMRASRFIGPLFGTSFMQKLLKQQVQNQPDGPNDAERAAGSTVAWGEASDERGGRVWASIAGPEAYDFSALTAAAIAGQVLGGAARPGFQTPARLLGATFVLGLPGVKLSDVF